MGDNQNQLFQLSFNRFLRVDFQGSRVTSDGGLLLVRELDERLGLPAFIRRYVHGWAETGQDYFSIPLEKDTYAVQNHYVAQANASFSVEEEVRRQLDVT